MALSEYEKKTLEQIAQELERDDPRLASKMTLMPGKASGHLGAGILTCLAGCLVLITGIAARAPALGIIGFTIMGTGAYLATIRIRSLRIRRRPEASPSMGPAELG
ncbi:DUF3040 domain-containing protein [Arthrobacter bambusae]|uniref:DUF3040 domain-containing protein n=1 Tax=Arthrobacter bambusae TaxID=1338426 RepID=UPI00277D36EC|nr:DUF3040 domain-containing protein [Arthrobacter bambusae]MDQ0028701.1 hypothetical protein [Arthrobacter bambusae]MDQ0096505.1 hypothetical protein [Arthrobacter bambusae]